jgi:YegS/Rv2252/BmrU family lipid kinase
VTSVAVVAHTGKTFDGGLPRLRQLLTSRGISDPIWCEVPKSKKAPKAARKALDRGADLILVWGGDGMVQRVVDAVGDSGVTLGILPAGTANLFATNVGIPKDLEGALDTALHGGKRAFDVGVLNGERFAVMAGAGFDAIMIKEADGKLKNRWGRIAYLWTGVKATRAKSQPIKIKIDGTAWFSGKASCVLFGSLGTLTGGLVAFPEADPTDGALEVGVVTAEKPIEWARVVTRLASGKADRSPLTRMTRGRSIDVRFAKPTIYELDGGARKEPTRRLTASVEPSAIFVHVPEESGP